MDQPASFKVTLVRGDGTEVRRFILPKSALASYNILRAKLQVVFHDIKDQPFSVTWEDRDGDRITISSDEELMIAIKEMGGDVYRLRIEITEPGMSDSNGIVSGGPLHSFVACDICKDDVKGFRYKCMQCPNYDLCVQCEMKQHHKEHFMVRIPEPMKWKSEFGRRLLHHMSKSARKAKGAVPCGEGKGNSRHHHMCHSHECGDAGQRYLVPPILNHLFRSMWDSNAAQPEDQGRAAAGTSSERPAEPQEDRQKTYLRTIGKTVAHLLDPLGIDVNIEVETDKDKEGKCAEKEEETGDETKTKSDEKPQEASGPAESQSESDTTVSEVKNCKSKVTSPKKEKGESDTEEWTVINEETLAKAIKLEPVENSSSGTANNVTNQSSGATPKKRTAEERPTAPASPPHYPNLDFSNEEQRIPNIMHQPVPHNIPFLYPMPPFPNQNVTIHHPPHIPHPPIPPPPPMVPPPPPHMSPQVYPTHPSMPAFQQMNHLRPHIKQAFTQMTAMGFKNEGGWLLSLLEAVNGDVSKALDILQPVKK